MVPDTTLIVLAGAFLGTVLLEFGVLFAARRLRILAVPNSRSFHSQPTPTIGGVGFVVPVAVYLAVLSLTGVAPATGLLLGGLLLAVVGLWDDIRDLSSAFRLLCHVLAVALGLYFLDPPLSLAVVVVVGFGLVWYVNLFNFMDGIDGIAGGHVVFYCVAVQVLTGGVPGWLGEFTWLLSSAMVGFLPGLAAVPRHLSVRGVGRALAEAKSSA